MAVIALEGSITNWGTEYYGYKFYREQLKKY